VVAYFTKQLHLIKQTFDIPQFSSAGNHFAVPCAHLCICTTISVSMWKRCH